MVIVVVSVLFIDSYLTFEECWKTKKPIKMIGSLLK
jgi:hypothetical protein